MKIKSKQTNQPEQNNTPLFPRKVRLAILFAFIAVLLAIVATVGYTFNMIFFPTITQNTEQK